MAKYKSRQLRAFEPILTRNGFVLARTKGSHFIYINRITHKTISVNKDLNDMVRLRLIKENALEV